MGALSKWSGTKIYMQQTNLVCGPWTLTWVECVLISAKLGTTARMAEFLQQIANATVLNNMASAARLALSALVSAATAKLLE